MLKIAVVDDDDQFRRQIQEFIPRFFHQDTTQFSLRSYSDGLEFLADYHCNLDIAIIDIMMPHINGIDLAHKIRERDKHVLIMFITITPAFAIRGYEVSAVDYILKPLSYESDFRFKFQRAVNLALAQKEQRQELVLKDDSGRFIRLDIEQLCYVNKDRDDVVFHTKKGVFTQRMPIYKVSELLQGAKNFAYVNSGCLVNFQFIANIDGSVLEMNNGDKLVLSRGKKKDFYQAFFAYMDY